MSFSLCKAELNKARADGTKECRNRANVGEYCGRHKHWYKYVSDLPAQKKKTIKSKGGTQTILARAGSVRNGAVNSLCSSYKSNVVITDSMITCRDFELGIDYAMCWYCESGEYEVNEHLIPTCSVQKNTYGQNNRLNNTFPACRECNSSKSAKTGDVFYDWLKGVAPSVWTDEKLAVLDAWINKNRSILYVSEMDRSYLENKCFPTIDLISRLQHDAVLNKKDIDKAVLKGLLEDSEEMKEYARSII